jgi:hypothetical protein
VIGISTFIVLQPPCRAAATQFTASLLSFALFWIRILPSRSNTDGILQSLRGIQIAPLGQRECHLPRKNFFVILFVIVTNTPTPNASYSVTLRVKIHNKPGKLGEITTAIGRAGGDIEGIDIVSAGRDFLIRDITVNASSESHDKQIVASLDNIDGVEVVNVSDRTFLMHLGGKIEVVSKMPLKTRSDLSMAYTPGVARVCEAIHKDPEKRFNLTIKKNTVAVVSDGTAVLGLGDIGPAARCR